MIQHLAGPTTPYPLEGLMFYQQRCARCGTLLDLGRISPLPRFSEGEIVIREELTGIAMTVVYSVVWVQHPANRPRIERCQELLVIA